MDANKRPSAALINREWYESAKGVLNDAQMGRILTRAVEYVLWGNAPEDVSPEERIVFAMIKPSLDSDVDKYFERCARNAANAKGKREAASGSEWQRVATSGEQQQQQPQQQPKQQQQSLSGETDEEIDRDKYKVYGYFWSVGSSDPKAEYNAFWSYYEALGWKNNKGARIVSRLACARMWRRQLETREPKAGAVEWFRAFSECKIADISVFVCYAGAEVLPGDDRVVQVHLRATEAYIESIYAKVPECVEQFRRLVKADRVVIVAA